MKIGVYGGSFDPIHHAHLLIAQYILEELSLLKIIFVPAGIPPHKEVYSASEQRLEMVRLAIADSPVFECSDIEIKQSRVNYSVDTIEQFKNLLALDRENLFWILGSDNFLEFKSWKEPDKILDLCNVVVFPRNDIDFESSPPEYRDQAIYLSHAPLLDISSTRIRDLIREERSIKYWVPHTVEAFIYSEKLYV